jgi:hypothetical protein
MHARKIQIKLKLDNCGALALTSAETDPEKLGAFSEKKRKLIRARQWLHKCDIVFLLPLILNPNFIEKLNR